MDSNSAESAQKKSSNEWTKKWHRFLEWVWEPAEQWHAAGPISALRASLRVVFILVGEFQHDNIPLRAGALTFTVVLSLVPMLALGTAVLKGLGAGDQMREAAYRMIDQFDTSTAQKKGGLQEPDSVSESSAGLEDTASEDEASTPEGLMKHLRKAVDTVFDYVDRTNFATLGAFGILGLVFTVISVLGSIEQAMNVIWDTESGRPLGRKVMDYLALMILLPVSVNVGLASMATLESPVLLSRIGSLLPVSWIVPLLLNTLPVAVLVATFTVLYRFLPNMRVRLWPALVGGIFGGVGWLLVQALYVQLQIGVARYNAIYGSFATLPLVLIWFYVGWVVFLSGAEMAFAVQNWRQYLPGDSTMAPKARLALALDVLAGIFSDFSERQMTNRSGLARRLEVPEVRVGHILNDLIHAGLIRELEEQKGTYMPAAPAEKIRPVEVIDAICGKETQITTGGRMADEAFEAARNALAERAFPISPEKDI